MIPLARSLRMRRLDSLFRVSQTLPLVGATGGRPRGALIGVMTLINCSA